MIQSNQDDESNADPERMNHLIHCRAELSEGGRGERAHDVNVVAAGAVITHCGKHIPLSEDDYALVEELGDGYDGDTCTVCKKSNGANAVKAAHE